jgi:ketosteroid isomerase-like protein
MRARKLLFACFTAVTVVTSCSRHDDSTNQVRADIQRQLDRSVDATRTKDIDTYMDCIPRDFALKDEQGDTISREQLRQNILRDWSIIRRTLGIQTKIDSLEVHGTEATVFTSQHWEREMLERDGKTVDTVLTTQKHQETWRKTERGWMPYEIKELGGEVFVNGKPYHE